jgi:hypothetical protein
VVKKVGLILLLWGFAMLSNAASNLIQKPLKTCAQLSKDLVGMQNAQKSLLATFVRKNEMMAAVLDQNALRMETKIEQRQALKLSDLHSLKNSADAYRNHEAKEKELVNKFEQASSSLIGEIQKCLSNLEGKQSLIN